MNDWLFSETHRSEISIYEKGLGNLQFSMATAVGLFQSVIGVILVLLADKFAKMLGEEGLL